MMKGNIFILSLFKDTKSEFRYQSLGTREQPVGANTVFQHSELMVK